MIRLSKKAIGAISAVSVTVIATSIVLASFALKNEQTQTEKKKQPLDRDSNYHHYPISNKIAQDTKLNNLINKIEQDRSVVYVIDEQQFINNIKSLAVTALKNISAFSKTYLNYKFNCHYKINDTKSISVDLVWFEDNSKIRYYDQFVLRLEAI